MNRKFISWLSFLAVFTLMVHSCRNDYLPEKSETYNNSSKFQLTSQRISLSQSKHEAKLLPELEKVEAQFKAKTGALGKVVNYGNGVSIDTDDVIYIENGPNFHTYTFSIQNENTLPNDPIINLVLIPTTDGAYREMLISYHLTAQEKETLQNGGFVDTKEKFTITIPEQNTFNPLSSKSGQSCVWMEAIVGYTPCSANQHFNGELCDAKRKSQPIKEFFLKCTSISDGSEGGGGWEYGPGDGTEGGGGGGSQEPGDSTTEPCNGNGVATEPLDPNTDFGEGGGCTGIPTVISLPQRNNPCEKTKAMLERPNMIQAISEVKKQAEDAANNPDIGETGRMEKWDGTVLQADEEGEHHVTFYDITGARGLYHNHTMKGAKVHSPPDIVDILGVAAVQASAENYGDAYVGMIGAEKCVPDVPNCYRYFHYIIRFNGVAADLSINFTKDKMESFKQKYRRREHELSEILPYVDFLGDELNKKGLEKLFFDTLSNMGLSGKVVLQRVDDDGSIKTITLDENGVPKATPCP